MAKDMKKGGKLQEPAKKGRKEYEIMQVSQDGGKRKK